MEKIKKIEEIKSLVEKLENKKIVSTNGVFDILHIGHIRYLQEAKKLGDILIVGINSDSSTRKIKGPKRPLNNERDLCVFSELPKLQHKIDKPFFAFAHILIPHSPYRFGPNGETLQIQPLWWVDLDESDHIEGYRNQVIFVEKKVREVINKILSESEHQPIIIIQSDTGTSLKSENLTENIKRKMKILIRGSNRD